MTAASIAAAIGGHRSGAGWLCRCPLPGHGKGEGDRNPSLSVRDGDTALLVRCFAGCDSLAILDELRRRGFLDYVAGIIDNRAPAHELPHEPEPDSEALALWRAAEPIGGTLAEKYLRNHRGITIEPPASLRFLPAATYSRTGHLFPAMVAAVARPDRKVVACQLTWLGRDGDKAPVSTPRLTFGKLGGGAIRLAPAGEVLGLAEGVETALSAMQLSAVPTWATVGGLRLGKVVLPACVHEIHIFADDDEPGRLAAEAAADMYTHVGLKVTLRRPPEGYGDWNDLLTAGRRAA